MIMPLMVNSTSLVKVLRLDETLVGTPNYMGLAFFWNYEYRHFLRDTSVSKRVRVHHKLLQAGLEVNGSSDLHEQIITKETRK